MNTDPDRATKPTEIEITPAMVLAGVEAWKRWDGDSEEPENMVA